MSDYLAQVKIKNGRLWSLMKDHGINSQSDLARLSGLTATAVGNIINFKDSPMRKDGTWRHSVLKIADVFGVLPDEMFSPEQLMLEVESNNRDYLISHDEAMRLADQSETYLALPEDEKDAEMLRAVVGSTLDALTPREKKVIEMKYGVNGHEIHTIEDIARHFDVSRVRITQITDQALRRLRRGRLSFNLITAQGAEPPDWIAPARVTKSRHRWETLDNCHERCRDCNMTRRRTEVKDFWAYLLDPTTNEWTRIGIVPECLAIRDGKEVVDAKCA